MSDLPAPAPQGNNPISTNTTNNQINQLGSISVGKELESVAGFEQSVLKDVSGQEIEISKEVVAAGVKAQPTTVHLSTNVQQFGVQPVGQSGPAGQATTVVLPLTDDQIAQGLHQGITSSFRWLAEWCIRRLKQVHVGLKYIHGKLFRVNYA